MNSAGLQEFVRPQDTRTFAGDQQVSPKSLPHKAEVLGYVSVHRSISPELLRPLNLHSKRSSSLSMGATCSKSSSVGLSSKANEDLRSSPHSISSPYLSNNLASTRSNKPQPAGNAAVSDLIPAQHEADPAGQLQNALAASAATAVLSEASMHAATAVATGTAPPYQQQPSIAQQSLQDASAVYTRPAYHHKTASSRRKLNGASPSPIRHASFPEALKAVVAQPSQEGFTQLLQQHLFETEDLKVVELDNLVAAIAAQPAQTQASCASLMVAHAFFFAAMKAVFVFPQVLKAVLDDIHLQVDVQQAERVDAWRWAEADLRLLLQQFRGLKVTQQYKQTQKQLTALGPEGQAPLARVQMEMLGKVVNDFLAQLGAQLSNSPAAAGLPASGMTKADTDLEAQGRMVKSEPVEGVDGEMGVSKGSGRGQGGSRGELSTNQVNKKNGLQHKREQMKAGERRKRQQAATLGVSPTLVARPHVSARSLAQQQVLAQHQQRGSAAAVAQKAAAEKLQMEQRALERDYQQLRRDQLRFEEEQRWAAQQQAQSPSSQPQAASRFAQDIMPTMAGSANPPDQATVALGSGSIYPTPLPVQAPTPSSNERPISQHAAVTQQSGPHQASMTWPPKYEKDDSTTFPPAQRLAPTQLALSEVEQQGRAPANSPAGQISAALQAKGAQFELERQYSQLQLQHQQSLDRHEQQARLAQQAQQEEEYRLQQDSNAEAEEQRVQAQHARQEQVRVDAELARHQAEEEDRRQQQAMAREAKELAQQRAALEAALAAERVNGSVPMPLATPKPVKGISNGGDADASEVEDDPASASDDEEVSETEGSDFEDEVAVTKSRSNKPLTSKTAKTAASVESESVADESEDYQEDFEEEEEEQALPAAAQKKKGVQSGGP